MANKIRKSNHVSLLMYQFVLQKYICLVIEEDVDTHLKYVYTEISKHYEMQFLEIGT